MIKQNKLFIFIMLPLLISLVACDRDNRSKDNLQQTIDTLSWKIDSLEANIQQLKANKKLVADMYQELFGDKNVDAADKFINADYIQHNPGAADGRNALKTVLNIWFKNAPGEQIDIRHLGADSSFVYIHTKMTQGESVYSVMDIFRIENNMIIEHWDVIQQVPDKSANAHPMF
jgi:predicted SnoaL-like aldol condensation-catalyzing enzyme